MKDRGAIVSVALTALLAAGGFAAFALSGQNTSAPLADGPRLLLGQVGAGMEGSAPAPYQAPTAGGAGAGSPTTLPPDEKKRLSNTSFAGVPPSYPSAGGNTGFGGGQFGGPSPFGAAPAPGATTGPDFSKLKPYINRGRTAATPRKDPFVSYRIPKYERPPAYSFLAPLRLAAYPEPPKPEPSGDPERDFGPLPFVPRRVAGVLYNGEVTAILEIGPPGTSAEVFIVQPGSKVPSGIPGVEELTVTSISPTDLVLRAEDGRRVTVALSGAPSLQGLNPGAGGGFPGAGPGGFSGSGPGGPPGGFRGGSSPGGFGGGRGGADIQ